MNRCTLREWRRENHVTLAELAGLTGISESMLSRVERDERTLRPLDKIKVARAIDVAVEKLFPREQ